MVAVAPFTDAAGYADRGIGGSRIDVHVVGVNERWGVPHLAPKANRITPRRLVVGPA